MRKPPTGEPCAGEPHARFGGRGGATFPDPYHPKDIFTLAIIGKIPFSGYASYLPYQGISASF